MRYNRIEENVENASLRTTRTITGVNDEATEKIKVRCSPAGWEPSFYLLPRPAPAADQCHECNGKAFDADRNRRRRHCCLREVPQSCLRNSITACWSLGLSWWNR